MDNLTHSLIGALIGQAGLKRRTGLAMPALIIGANLPDIDATCVAFGIESLAMRRGLTHGPVAWVLLPLVLAAILWWFDRWQARRGKRPEGRPPVHFGWLYALAFIACLTHPALDWLNNYGIRLLEPFSHRWFYGDTLFIIDVWLWAGLGLATWLSFRRERRGGNWRAPARAALVAALAYIGLNTGISWQLGRHVGTPHLRPEMVIANPQPLAFWSRDVLWLRNGVWWNSQRSLFGWEAVNVPVATNFCALHDARDLARTRPDLRAFLFWSRAPFVERTADGRVLLKDARFASQGGDRFSVVLPTSICRAN